MNQRDLRSIDRALDAYADGIARVKTGMATRLSLGHAEVACGKGCAWCCYLWVATGVTDGLSIARYMYRNKISLVPLLEAANKQQEHATKYRFHELVVDRDMDREHEMCNTWMLQKNPCPFLVNNECAVYPVRPVACWSHLAVKPEAPLCCERDLEGLVTSVPCIDPTAEVGRAVGADFEITRALFGKPLLMEPLAVAVRSALTLLLEVH